MSDEKTIGYKKPPKSHRFTPGRSGNPAGRPKGVRNLKTDLNALLKKRIAVREDGETRNISRQEAILLSLFSKAIKGDVKATTAIIGMCMKFDPPGDEIREPPRNITPSDETIIEDYLKRQAANKTVQNGE